MKLMNTVGAMIVFALLLVPNALGQYSRGGCDNSSLRNTFGFTLTGSRIDSNPGPRAAVGQLTADGNGNLSGSETQSNNGTIVTGVTATGPIPSTRTAQALPL